MDCSIPFVKYAYYLLTKIVLTVTSKLRPAYPPWVMYVCVYITRRDYGDDIEDVRNGVDIRRDINRRV